MSDNILVVAAHTDDETLGCGGTIAKHTANGDKVSVVFMTDGVSARTQIASDAVEKRKFSTNNAMKILGISDIYTFNFPDNSMDTVPLIDLVKAIESVIEKTKPNTIYTHFAHDLNIDHRLTHNAVMTACRPQIGSSVKKIFSFEVLSSTEWNSPTQPPFIPQYIVNIDAVWDKKYQALQCYHEELRPFPHSRSLTCIEAQAILRGASYGFKKAEAFHIERILES
ncbi:MAG: LmbE family N-acetylglucosaminyl deacetylase [Colwellia sp.]|jgi:LmbE family N-acetylglucosaminyl deacetylase